MTYIRTVAEEEATGALARAYQQSRQELGRVFETEKLLSLWPEALAMEKRRYQTVILADTNLTRGEKEMIAGCWRSSSWPASSATITCGSASSVWRSSSPKPPRAGPPHPSRCPPGPRR